MGWGARRRVIPVLLLLTSAFLAGCRLDARLAIDVESSGAGTLHVALATDAELVRRLRAADADPFSQLVRTVRQQDGWQVTRRVTADGGTHVALQTRFADAADLTRLTTQLSRALNAPELRVLEPFELAIDGRTMTVRGRALFQPGPGIRDYGLTPSQAVALVADRQTVAYTVRISMPGTVELTDGMTTADGAVRYRVEPGSAVDVLVVARRPAPWRLIVLVVAALVALLAALALRRRRSRP